MIQRFASLPTGFQSILFGLAALSILVVMFFLASLLGKWARRAFVSKERIERLANEPVEMTCERRTTIGGVTVTLGDMLERFERESNEQDEDGNPVMVPRARVVRVITLSGIPILRTSAESKALAAAIEGFAKDQDDMAWHS